MILKSDFKTVTYPSRYGVYTIRVQYDEFPDSPRNWSNLATMVCWHRRYRLGDKHPFDCPEEFLDEAKSEPCIMMPLFLYDHSGISISTGHFGDRWDSMQVGFIYVPKKKVCQEFGWKRLTASRISRIETLLSSEVDYYDRYLRGEVFGYTAEDAKGNEINSCYGFYGIDMQENGLMDNAISSIQYDIGQKDKQLKEQVNKHLAKLQGWIRCGLPFIYRKPLQITL